MGRLLSGAGGRGPVVRDGRTRAFDARSGDACGSGRVLRATLTAAR